MDSLKFLLYTLARIGIFIALNVFAVVCGMVLFPTVATFIPDSNTALNDFFINENVGSFVGWLVMLVFLAVLFFDDGKRHAAYEFWSSVNVTITLIFMLLVYFVPAIFRDSFAAEGRGSVFYELYYFPCRWLYEGVGLEYTLSVASGAGIILVCLFVMYVLSFKLYVKKHPVIFKAVHSAAEDEGGSDDEESQYE